MKWIRFWENNSGGWYCNPEDAMHVVVEAVSEYEAIDILQSQEWYTDDYCTCCGTRWGSPEEVSFEDIDPGDYVIKIKQPKGVEKL
jgi:hypothetical protein